MKIISFRPTFRIPRIVSLLGALGCLFMMFLINPIFSVVALCIIIILYFWLEKRGLQADWGDIRGGLFLVLAERASRLAMKFPRHQVTWKPDLLVPIDDPNIWAGPLLFIRNITYPSGSIFAFTVKDQNLTKSENDLKELMSPLKNEGILVNSTLIEDQNFLHGAKLVIQTLKAGTFKPNVLFLTLGSGEEKDEIIRQLVNEAAMRELGVMILRQHPRMAFGMQKTINLWLRDKSPNWHLAMLITLQIQLNWEAKINLVTATPQKQDERRLYQFLERLNDQARLPSKTYFFVLIGEIQNVFQNAPKADINIFGLGENIQFDFIRNATEWSKSSCLFVKDSGKESAIV